MSIQAVLPVFIRGTSSSRWGVRRADATRAIERRLGKRGREVSAEEVEVRVPDGR